MYRRPARFAGNPHIVPATKKDLVIPAQSARSTFPQPLPNYLTRNSAIAPAVPTAREPVSASAGRFSMGLKGMRKELRKSGPRTELLVKEVEDAIMGWLDDSVVWLNPDVHAEMSPEEARIGTLDLILQVSCTHHQLVWAITDDAFARYVVHCCARYHNIVSFSKSYGSR